MSREDNVEKLPLKLGAYWTPRILETVAHLKQSEPSSGTAPFSFPVWAQNVGRMIAGRVLPAEAREAAASHPLAFANGLLTGLAIRSPEIAKISDADKPEIERALAKIAVKTDAPLTAASLEGAAIENHDLTADVLVALKASPDERLAFFRGFALGLGAEEFLGKVTRLYVDSLTNPKSRFGFYLFLFLRWPELEERKTPADAYAFIDKEFLADGKTDAVGSADAFRETWRRLHKEPTPAEEKPRSPIERFLKAYGIEEDEETPPPPSQN